MFKPFGCSLDITSLQQEPSANSPWTKTTLRAFSGRPAADAAMPLVESIDAAAPASIAVENVRLFMIIPDFLSS
ncbi:hypothetical protein N7E02_06300 (plasmid) [Aliirhizobium terrae]|uniref:hypothetical protein n=1 Tax=Terrirhizobium terrae TaxID=2926709 RepID=UPI0025765CBD|nr:hypothetical protein [Rhizobium sp. CC-CFT758]WJH38892.1 hypothetical protein N7E02_06300 [Rhizobium sp. CC-CFT758]